MLALFCKPVVVIEPPKKQIITPQDCRIIYVKEIKDNALVSEFLEPVDWLQAPPVVIDKSGGK
jgi:hypothetical protein